MSKVICYYHKVDLDGKCSAAIVRRKYPDCELIGVNYPDKPDFEAIHEDCKVIVVDFSFDAYNMDKINTLTMGGLIWIDHHKSAIEKMIAARLDKAFDGKREIGKAGCELTWEYLFPEEPMPDAVRLLGRYDVWDHADEDVLPFQYGMRMDSDWHPDFNQDWKELLRIPPSHANILLERIKNAGYIILKYEAQQNAVYAKAAAFPVEFDGHKAWAINKAVGNSKIFESLSSQDRPLWILFRYKAGMWRYSLYSAPSSGIDVSKIAGKYGGGGHAGAAGFQSDKYLLKDIAD